MPWPWTFTCEIGTTRGLVPDGWEDVSDRLRAESDVSYGRSDEDADDLPGTGLLWLDNQDGRWDPGIPPNTAIRIKVDVDGETFPLWYAVVERAPALWPAYGVGRVQVTASDGLSLLANTSLTMDMGKQRSHERVASILDAVGWPESLRDIGEGVVLLDPAEGDVGALWALQRTVKAEQGQMWIAPDGSFTFRGRHARLDLDPVRTFSADPGGETVELIPDFDRWQLYQWGRAEMADGRVFEVGEEPQLLLGEEYVVRDVNLPWHETLGLLQWALYRYGEPTSRFSRLEVEGRQSSTLLKDLLVLAPGDLVRVEFGPDAGHQVDELVQVERVAHREQSGSWRTVLDLSPYFGAGTWSRWDETDSTVEAMWAP